MLRLDKLELPFAMFVCFSIIGKYYSIRELFEEFCDLSICEEDGIGVMFHETTSPV